MSAERNFHVREPHTPDKVAVRILKRHLDDRIRQVCGRGVRTRDKSALAAQRFNYTLAGEGLPLYARAKAKRRTSMSMLIIRHKVSDYGKWRPAFDSHSAMQKAAGLSNPRVLRSADDKNEIVIIFDTTDTKKAKEFATSSDLKDVMTKAGVIDVPTMYFLESI